MPQAATIKCLPVAFAMLKAMQAEGVEWGEDYRAAARQALVELLEGRMAETIGRHLERTAERGQADRRKGANPRWLLTDLGMNRTPRATHPHLQRAQGGECLCPSIMPLRTASKKASNTAGSSKLVRSGSERLSNARARTNRAGPRQPSRQ